MKDKLRKVGSHLHRNRGKYLMALCAAALVTIVLVYNEKEQWAKVATDVVDELNDAESLLEANGLLGTSVLDTL